MENLKTIKAILKTAKADLFEKYPIKTMAIFGSYARNEQHNKSDVDILVEFKAPVGIEFIDLADSLEALLKTRVDLVSKKGLKPRYFSEIKRELNYI